ncbi:hypothetical protein GLAREA_03895 [Glarea lozoyensis ATCC 20868]|uniref:DUF6590 domain-containing protein n=1 Tax=Glarea lozoyensis (strain ATCC 20868 / MF5171) TaxID=1116229 RepID=S3DX18_GLAL2|nr:uncharacterized protein GLAREA_03895 [Glarea lozoyensis ATCC 20868]EPE30928.1 hypothetical protein GLAREA_03895 [Glarea lozoyensis ATCC 20868]
MDGMELGPGPSAVRMPSNTAVWRGRIFLRPAETGPSIGAASITNCCTAFISAPENSGYSGLPNITGSHYDYRPASAISQTNEDGITNPQVKAKTIHGYNTESSINRDDDINFRVHHHSQFKIGYVIKLLWVEPRGESSRNSERSRNGEDTDVTDDDGPSSTKGFSKTRRFVIVKVFTGHCTCLPLLTYSGQGVVKRGVHPEVHAAVFTADGPKLAPGEADVLTRPPIRFLSKSPREKLDPMTRLNYAKLYTVEYNIKLRFIGKIDPTSMPDFIENYNDVHKVVWIDDSKEENYEDPVYPINPTSSVREDSAMYSPPDSQRHMQDTQYGASQDSSSRPETASHGQSHRSYHSSHNRPGSSSSEYVESSRTGHPEAYSAYSGLSSTYPYRENYGENSNDAPGSGYVDSRINDLGFSSSYYRADVSASSGREPASLSQGEDSSAASRFGYGYTNQRLSGSTSSFNRPQENPKNCWQDDPAAAGSGHGNSSISNAESPSDRPRAYVASSARQGPYSSDYGEDDPPALGTYVSSRNRGKTPIETYDHHDDLYDDN